MVCPCPRRRREEEDEKEERRLQHLLRHEKEKTTSSGTISDEMTKEMKKRADVALISSRGCRPSCVGVGGWVLGRSEMRWVRN